MRISTQHHADNAPPGIHRVIDAVGLYLKVGDTGKGSYFWRYRLGDKRREMGLGSRDKRTLDEARKAAKKLDVQRDDGIDPIDLRKRVKAENIAEARRAPTAAFKQMVENYLKKHGANWKHRYARSHWLSPLVRYAYPVIGALTLDGIELHHIIEIMESAEEAGAPEVAKRLQSRIERVLDQAIALSGKALRNPADHKLVSAAHPMRRVGEQPHFRAVDIDHAPEVYQTLKARTLTSTAFAAWCFMALTASRPNEALGARWEEINRDKKLWVIPAARMKSGRGHTVPLSPEALEILDLQMQVKTGDAVFPGRCGSPLSYDTFATAPKRAKPPIKAATPHGWRSVFRDWCGDVGDIERDLAEAALAHSLGATEASYRRRTAVEKRREVMIKYAAWLNGDGGARVLAFPDRKKA